MGFKDRFNEVLPHFNATLASFGRMWVWVIISLVLLALVTFLNPAKFGSYLWIVSKLSCAAVVGFGVDGAAFPGTDFSSLEGIEKTMAQTRRATLIAAAMIAAGLMP